MDNLSFPSGVYPDNLVSEKYYLIEQDSRFPLQPTGEWKPLLEAQRTSPNSIYILSGYGVQYIGKDSNGTRPQDHKYALVGDYHYNNYMSNKVNKHGISGFFYQELVKLPEDCIQHINIIENAYIKHFDTYHNGYNLLEFSQSSLGLKMSEESKQKLSIIRSKPYKLIDPIGNIIEGVNLYKFAKENNLLISNLNLVLNNKMLSYKGYRSFSESLIGVPYDPQVGKDILASTNHKTFTLVSPEGELITTKNIRRFCKERGLDRRTIMRVLKGEMKQCHGWHLPSTKKEELGHLSLQIPCVLQNIITGEIRKFDSLTNAAKSINASISNVANVFHKKNKTVKGWTLPKNYLELKCNKKYDQ